MAFTKTVNYIEGIPVSLNYSNEITGTGDVTVLMTYDSAGGRLLSTNTNPNLSVIVSGESTDRKDINEWKITGPVADVNAYLNRLEWVPRAFDSGAGNPSDDKGEPSAGGGGDGGDGGSTIFKFELGGNKMAAESKRIQITYNATTGEYLQSLGLDNTYYGETTTNGVWPYPSGAYTAIATTLEDSNAIVITYKNIVFTGFTVEDNPFDFTPEATYDEMIAKMPLGKHGSVSSSNVGSLEAPVYNNLGDYGQMLNQMTPYTIGQSGKNEGEIELDLYDQVGTFELGDTVRLQDQNIDDQSETLEYDYNFTVVKVEGTRIRLRHPGTVLKTLEWYKPGELLCSPLLANEAEPGKEIGLYLRIIKRNGEDITASGWIVDYSFGTAIGDYSINIAVNGIPAGTTKLAGELYSKRPVITGVPEMIYSAGRWEFTDGLEIGTVSDDDNAQLTVQLLIKRHENDPDYEWGNEFIKGKPSYVFDNSYGEFTQVRVGDRISRVDDLVDTAIRWEFFGSVKQCNQALAEVRLLDKKGVSPYCVDPTDDDYPETPTFDDDWTLDYFIEVRVLDGWTRTFSSRGYK